MKRCLGIIALILLLIGASGCEKKESTEDIAIITEASQEGAMTNAIKESAQQYAAENGLLLSTHSVAKDTPDDYMVAVKEAADAGASVVIGYGEKFEVPLYTMQKKYKKVKFIILDGAPRKEKGSKAKLRKNTHAIVYDEAQAGFLAGYAAVKEGYKNLGFMGGQEEESIELYGSGFVQGANYAASEMGLGKDEVQLRYRYMGTNEISPAIMAAAGDWFENGCEVIFSNGGSIGTAIIKAAEQKNGKVIASDTDQSQTSAAVLTSAVKNVNDVIYQTLGGAFGKDFQGKKQETMDLSNDGVSLTMDTSSFQNFTADDYHKIVTKIVDEEIKVAEEKAKNLQEKDGEIANIALSFD